MVRTISINILVLLSFLICAEAGLRFVYFANSCRIGVCDFRAFAFVNFIRGLETGLYQPEPIVGYAPKPGVYHIDGEGWDNKTVTVNSDTTRSNGNVVALENNPRILAVGDSFTFGVQVSDDETWPSALERRLHAEVVNAGVGGYGFGQAGLRARVLSKTDNFDLVILSVLVPDDLDRDQLVTRTSAAKPVWVTDGGSVKIIYPEESKDLRSKMMSEDIHLPEFFGYSYLLMQVNKRIFGYYYGQQLKHPDAADIDDIICYVIEDFSTLAARTAILFQYRLEWILADAPPATARLEECAREYNVPAFNSYDFIRERQNVENLYFGHMRPVGNEALAEYLDREIRKAFPDLF